MLMCETHQFQVYIAHHDDSGHLRPVITAPFVFTILQRKYEDLK